MTIMRRLAWAMLAAATGAVSLILGAPATVVGAAPAPAAVCPPGTHEDTETPGFQCVPGWCPSGMLLDGVTGACVTAPGVPPPPLR